MHGQFSREGGQQLREWGLQLSVAPIASFEDAKRTYSVTSSLSGTLQWPPYHSEKEPNLWSRLPRLPLWPQVMDVSLPSAHCSVWYPLFLWLALSWLDFQLSFLFTQPCLFWTLFHISLACVEAPSFVVLHFSQRSVSVLEFCPKLKLDIQVTFLASEKSFFLHQTWSELLSPFEISPE